MSNVGGARDSPLGRAEVDELGRLEELEVDERLGGRQVLHVVAIRGREDAGVAGLEVEGARGAAARERGRARVAADDVQPLW